MERKKSIIGKSLEINGITIIPIINMLAWCNRLRGTLSVYGSIHPSHVVLINNDGIKVFTIHGEDMSVAQLTQEIPELREILN